MVSVIQLAVVKRQQLHWFFEEILRFCIDFFNVTAQNFLFFKAELER